MIKVFLIVDEFLKENDLEDVRERGPSPKIADSETITMEIVGESLGYESDKRIHQYFKTNWLPWFPRLGSRSSFVRQTANLWKIKERIHMHLTSLCGGNVGPFLFDGFPIPIRSLQRLMQSQNFRAEGAVGYCAAKDEKYFGFKGHLLVNAQGCPLRLGLSAANIDEREILPRLTHGLFGDIIADKGLIGEMVSDELAVQAIKLHTPLRKNMQETRSQEFIKALMSMRKRVEVTISQLVGRFNIQKIKAKDFWHLSAKVGRKLLAFTTCFCINKELNPEHPLQFNRLFT